jgi:predicted RNase H-like HicB family nuclease
MEKSYAAVIKQEGDWWIGWVEEIPGINCQEYTQEELLETLKVTLKEALEMNKNDALSAAGSNYSEVLLRV